MKKTFISVVGLMTSYVLLLGGCVTTKEEITSTKSSLPETTLGITEPTTIATASEENKAATKLTRPIYAETREEIIIGILNSFGGHDPDTFKYYPSDNGDYNKMYERFRSFLPEEMDYRDERTFEDFDTYEITGSDMDRSRYCCYLHGCTDAGVYIMIRYNYEKEMYYAQNISTSIEDYETAVENYTLVNLKKE